jgi:hypothetical protein
LNASFLLAGSISYSHSFVELSVNNKCIPQEKAVIPMKNPLKLLLEIISQRILGSKKPLPPVPCEFCGKTDHASNDCPNAAKYKLFDVDRE